MEPQSTGRLFGRRFFLFALILLSLIQISLSALMLVRSKALLREQIEARMLDIANAAAYQLNGDELATLTADDIGTAPYERALETLRAFQTSIQLEYIYGIREAPDGSFSFTIDPEPDDPGAFGEPIAPTDALITAAHGTPAVDQTPYTDKWGRFYSAYSPVFDSQSRVAGIVAVDFNADWFDSKINSYRIIVVFLTMFALTVVILLAIMVHTVVLEDEKAEYRRRLEETLLREQIQEEALGSARSMAYTDPLTGVKSKRAYLEAAAEIDRQIEGTLGAEFALVVCDMNGLKAINDTRGHEEGDRYIKRAARLICTQFSHSPVFRIGGDEFVVLLSGADYDGRKALLAAFDRQAEENLRRGDVVVSAGMAVFKTGRDHSFSDVFEAADRRMYARKHRLKAL